MRRNNEDRNTTSIGMLSHIEPCGGHQKISASRRAASEKPTNKINPRHATYDTQHCKGKRCPSALPVCERSKVRTEEDDCRKSWLNGAVVVMFGIPGIASQKLSMPRTSASLDWIGTVLQRDSSTSADDCESR